MAEIFQSIISIIASFLSIFGLINTSGPSLFLKETTVETIAAYDTIRSIQGGCTDGTYIYEVLIDPSSSNEYKAKIVKIDPKKWEVVAESAVITDISHANDITYNPVYDCLVVTNNYPYYTTISKVDAKTLKYEGGVIIGTPIYAVTYVNDDEDGYCYYGGVSGSYDFVKFDLNFNVIEKFTGKDNGCTRQSMETDGEYIYFVYSGSNSIYKYDLSGNYIGCFQLPDQTNEAENVILLDGNLYVTYNIAGTGNGGVIRQVKNYKFK